MWISCSMTCFSKNAIHLYRLIQMAWMWAYFHPAFLSSRCTYKDWTFYYQVFPMKSSKAFQIWPQCVENKWEGNGVTSGWKKLDCILTKSNRIIWYILCDMGLPCSKLNNSYLIKDRNICRLQKVHKHSLIRNELVSPFIFKKNIKLY